MAVRLANRLLANSVLDYISLNNNVEITEIKLSGSLVDKSILEADLRQKYGLNIIAIERENKTDIEINPNYRFSEGDIIVVVGKKDNVQKFEDSLN